MVKKTIVVIDDHRIFLDQLDGILEERGLKPEYEYYPILTSGRTADEVLKYCYDEIGKLLTDNNRTIEIVLVDIVIFEQQADPGDRLGLDIAKHISPLLRQVPIVGITRFIKAYRLLSEISLEPYLHGILLKPFIESSEFSRRDFLDIMSKAKEKARIMTQNYTLPQNVGIDIHKTSEGRFQLPPNEPRCHVQVEEEIGKDDFMVLLENLFPLGQGTVTYLRPGFSGSYLFKVSVKTVDQKISPSSPKTWVVKISDDKRKLRDELERCVKLKNRVLQDMYPQLLKEELTTIDKWAALVFEMQEDALTFSEYLNQGHSIKKITKLIDDSLFPFLKKHYGDSDKKPCFVWETFYLLDEKTRARVLAFIDEAQTLVSPRLGSLYKEALDRIKNFIISNGTNEESISKLAPDCDTRYIHGDLHSRNILVSDNASKLVFIDFANSDQDHYMKDIAKLETDLIFLVMDSNKKLESYWDMVTDWEQILELYGRGKVFMSRSLKTTEDSEVIRTMKLIQALRRGLKKLGNQPDEQQYLIALLHYTLKLLSYSDVSIQKKVFAVRYIQEILNAIHGR